MKIAVHICSFNGDKYKERFIFLKKIVKNYFEINKNIKIFIQINIGNEIQKNGITPDKLENFYKICTKDLNLNIIGLMCLPPKNLDKNKYFLVSLFAGGMHIRPITSRLIFLQ